MIEPSEVERFLQAHGIDTSQPGFYDAPAFVAVEREDSSFLDHYAAFVNARDYNPDYLQRARAEIPLIASICHRELVADGRLGACVDIGMMLSRMLEREGFWNYLVKGSLTITFPTPTNIGSRYFWSFDLIASGQPAFAAAHAWIVAPPFAVVDVAVRQQPYDRGRELLPESLIVDRVELTEVTIEDVFSPRFRAFAASQGVSETRILETYAPAWPAFTRRFPPASVQVASLMLTYIPVGIGAPDQPFEEMNIWRCNGRSGIEIYRESVVPELTSMRQQ